MEQVSSNRIYTAGYEVAERILRAANKDAPVSKKDIYSHADFVATDAPKWVVTQVVTSLMKNEKQLMQVPRKGLERFAYYFDAEKESGSIASPSDTVGLSSGGDSEQLQDARVIADAVSDSAKQVVEPEDSKANGVEPATNSGGSATMRTTSRGFGRDPRGSHGHKPQLGKSEAVKLAEQFFATPSMSIEETMETIEPASVARSAADIAFAQQKAGPAVYIKPRKIDLDLVAQHKQEIAETLSSSNAKTEPDVAEAEAEAVVATAPPVGDDLAIVSEKTEDQPIVQELVSKEPLGPVAIAPAKTIASDAHPSMVVEINGPIKITMHTGSLLSALFALIQNGQIKLPTQE